MRHIYLLSILFCFSLSLMGTAIFAQTGAESASKKTISYQGILTSSETGNPVNDILPVTVTLYSDEAGTEKLWQGSYITQFNNGLFQLQLGSGDTPLPELKSLDKQLWAGVRINGGDELRPLTILGAVPLALNVSDKSITKSKINTDYVSSIKVDGQKITGIGTSLNLKSGPGILLGYDKLSNSLIFGSQIGTGEQHPQWIGNGSVGCGTANTTVPNPVTNSIGGGCGNTASGTAGTGWASVLGGTTNTASGDYSSIGGGNTNIANGTDATVGGGTTNTASGTDATIGGGNTNTASGTGSIASGGTSNTASNTNATVSGGNTNSATGTQSTVAGGISNSVSSIASTISGGTTNTISSTNFTSDYSVISGGSTNTDYAIGGTVGGGGLNSVGSALALPPAPFPAPAVVTSDYSTISGGYNNITFATALFPVPLPTPFTSMLGDTVVIGGGAHNTALWSASTISGGSRNFTNASYSSIGGGRFNTTTGTDAVVGGGTNNTAGAGSAVPGGRYTKIGSNSLAFNGDVNNQLTDLTSNSYNNVAYIGEADLWIGNVNNSARQVRFYEPNNGDLTYTSVNFSSFTAGSQSADINYTLPLSIGSTGSILISGNTSGNSSQMSWLAPGGNGSILYSAGSSIGYTGTPNSGEFLTFNGSVPIWTGTVTANQYSGILPVANGGTGTGSYTTGDIIYSNAANSLAKRSIGSAGDVLTVVSGVPQWQAVSAGTDWALTGNANTNPGVGNGQNYLGTRDGKDLVLATNATSRITVGSSGGVTISGAMTTTGTLDQRGTISNSTGNVTIGDALTVTGAFDQQGAISNSSGNNGGDVFVDDGMRITGAIKNSSNNNNGAVFIDDALAIGVSDATRKFELDGGFVIKPFVTAYTTNGPHNFTPDDHSMYEISTTNTPANHVVEIQNGTRDGQIIYIYCCSADPTHGFILNDKTGSNPSNLQTALSTNHHSRTMKKWNTITLLWCATLTTWLELGYGANQ